MERRKIGRCSGVDYHVDAGYSGGNVLRMYIVSSFFPAGRISTLAVVIVVIVQSVATPDAPRDGSSRMDHPGPASSSWCRCGTLIPGMMRDGNLHHFDLRLLVVGFDANQVWMYDLGPVVRDLHGRHVWNLDVQGLRVWRRNRVLLRDLQHLMHFRSVYLQRIYYSTGVKRSNESR